jgi:hypothetical protein
VFPDYCSFDIFRVKKLAIFWQNRTAIFDEGVFVFISDVPMSESALFFCLLVCADLLTKQKPLPKNHLSNLWGKLSYRI